MRSLRIIVGDDRFKVMPPGAGPALVPGNSAELHEELQEEARSHPYACRIIQGYLDDDIPLTFEAEDPEDQDLQAHWDPHLGFVFSL